MISVLWIHKNTALVLALFVLACITGFVPPETEVVGVVGPGCQTVLLQDRGDLGAWQGPRATKEAASGSSMCNGEARKIADRYIDGGDLAINGGQRDRIIARR